MASLALGVDGHACEECVGCSRSVFYSAFGRESLFVSQVRTERAAFSKSRPLTKAIHGARVNYLGMTRLQRHFGNEVRSSA